MKSETTMSLTISAVQVGDKRFVIHLSEHIGKVQDSIEEVKKLSVLSSDQFVGELARLDRYCSADCIFVFSNYNTNQNVLQNPF